MDARSSKILAIICAKKDSERYPYKNRELIFPVLSKLLKFSSVNSIVVATDDPVIRQLTKKGKVRYLVRKNNACFPEDSVFNIARWAYYCLDERYDIVIVILPNVINFKTDTVGKGIRVLVENNLNEVRTYDNKGVENGVIIMKENWFLGGDLSVYCGAIISEAKEIHYESELESL